MFQAEGTVRAKALRWEVGQGGAQGSRTREGVLQGSPPVKVSDCQAEAFGLYRRWGQCLRPQRARGILCLLPGLNTCWLLVEFSGTTSHQT